jgi:hypothetical protein
MDQEAMRENMHFDMEENRDANYDVYETPNMGIDLEPNNLIIEEQCVGHWVFLMGMGV